MVKIVTNEVSNEIFYQIRNWAHERNIIEGATPAAQYEKLLEEVGELGRGLIEGDESKTIDAIGDCAVVLIILAAQCEYLTFEECVYYAYQQIKDRKGKMIDGKFVKEA